MVLEVRKIAFPRTNEYLLNFPNEYLPPPLLSEFTPLPNILL